MDCMDRCLVLKARTMKFYADNKTRVRTIKVGGRRRNRNIVSVILFLLPCVLVHKITLSSPCTLFAVTSLLWQVHVFTLLAIWLAAGALYGMLVEEWGLVTSVYFSVAALSTGG